MDDQKGESPANIVGGIIGSTSGAALGDLLAKYLGLNGWKKWETLKGGVKQITYKYAGEIIVVRGVIANGIFKIGDA